MQPFPINKKYSFPVVYDPESFYPDAQFTYVYTNKQDDQLEVVIKEWANYALNHHLLSYVHDELTWQQHAHQMRLHFWFDCGSSGQEATFESLCDFLADSRIAIDKVVFAQLEAIA